MLTKCFFKVAPLRIYLLLPFYYEFLITCRGFQTGRAIVLEALELTIASAIRPHPSKDNSPNDGGQGLHETRHYEDDSANGS
jgi:hypothetical protein